MSFVHNLGENAGYELACFGFYWLTGYLFYSALFAAVGSAVDSETETQQFMFPITLPLLFTYILSVSYLFQAPDSPLAVWLSMIPLTAPVAMMVRIPFHVPGWQLAISMSLMVVGFLFTTYVASRIYRVGILMYGKKASYKELAKWFFYKE
jgi:ABC-2 type transport system permease protein